MPSVTTKQSTSVFYSASALPSDVWSTFKSNPRNSNIIYAHALKAAQRQHDELSNDDLWIVCRSDDDLENPLDFVLSCTRGPLGNYPIFIFCALPAIQHEVSFLVPRVRHLANVLHKLVPLDRVYSVFALDVVTRIFAEAWYRLTKVQWDPEPYYAAKITFCTKRTLRVRQFTTLPDVSYDLRLAVTADTYAVAKLCHGFAAESAPFVLTMDQALEEATLLIEQRQVWVHTIKVHERPEEIASIVAVTRESPSVAAITKVYTNPDWRSRRCAERLVRKVTQMLLTTKESVVLYVAHTNPAASKVYHRVGFVGLDNTLPPVEGVDSWLELGFDRDTVTLGHW